MQILHIIQGHVQEGDEMTHTLFAETGGTQDADYVVSVIPTKRTFRSKFAEFWFKKHVAPHILFRTYTAEALQILFSADEQATGGAR